MGSTISIIVRVRNSTKHDITSTEAFDIDSFDFGSQFRPDRVLKNLVVPAGKCVEKMLEINSMASNCPFALQLNFSDGTSDVFKINSRCAYDGTDANLRHTTRTHCIYHKKPGPRILEIVVQHTPEQKENLKAEHLLEEGAVLMAAGKYEEASIKLLEASQKANRDETKSAIQKNREKLQLVKDSDVNKRAELVRSEGLKLYNENKYQQAVDKFGEALTVAKNPEMIILIENELKMARQARANQEAKKLNQEALLLRKNDDHERALIKFDEALKLAQDPTIAASIKANKAETLYKGAMTSLDEAWLAETAASSSSIEDSIRKFARAKYLLEEASGVKPEPQYRKLLEVLEVKVEGNKLFTTGLHLEREGSRLIDETVKSESCADCKMAEEKYKEAWKFYTGAKKKFEEGLKKDERFKVGLKLTVEALSGIEKILCELEKTELEIVLRTEVEE